MAAGIVAKIAPEEVTVELVKLPTRAVATQPSLPARVSLTTMFPRAVLGVDAPGMAAPRGTDAVGTVMERTPPVTAVVTGVPPEVAADAGSVMALNSTAVAPTMAMIRVD